MLKVSQSGDFSKTTKRLKKMQKVTDLVDLNRYGKQGVAALTAATPVDSGLTAQSWYYEIDQSKERVRIQFCNSNIQNGVPIAIILQYGHGTGTGGWIEGRDYINPSIRPVFDDLANDLRKEVQRL